MPSRDADDNDDWEQFSDESWEEKAEPWDEDDEDETCPCPYCGEPVHEDAEQCPHCEYYLSDEDAPAAAKPWWIIAGVITVLAIITWWTMMR